MSFVLKFYGDYTRIDYWPAIEPKPSSEQAMYIGEHPVGPTVYQGKKKLPMCTEISLPTCTEMSLRTIYLVVGLSGQIQLEEYM